jgi:hypothetical protein
VSLVDPWRRQIVEWLRQALQCSAWITVTTSRSGPLAAACDFG